MLLTCSRGCHWNTDDPAYRHLQPGAPCPRVLASDLLGGTRYCRRVLREEHAVPPLTEPQRQALASLERALRQAEAAGLLLFGCDQTLFAADRAEYLALYASLQKAARDGEVTLMDPINALPDDSYAEFDSPYFDSGAS
jgi:hypothetical protein